MHDLNRIRFLLDQNQSLSDRFGELDALLDNLHTLRESQQFIPEELNSSICSTLTQLKMDQNTFLANYESLNFGATPSTITECKAELKDYETYILEKSSFVEVLQFVLSLDSDNADAKAALKQHQIYAAAYDCRSNSVAQCEEDLKKYILLRKAFEEKDPANRLSSIIELSPMIDFPLVVALNTNALTCKNKSDETEEIDNEIEVDSDDIDTYSQTSDFTVPKRTVSNRPAPDEAPISHVGIESGLTAELNHVLSRENTAASLGPDVVHTATLPKVDSAPAGKALPDPWGSLGIYNPAAVCYSVPDEKMEVFRCERPKRFSASDFQKEMALKSKNRFEKQNALKDAYKYGATSPEMLAALIKEAPVVVADACDTLVESGYLKAFKLSDAAYANFDKLYVLTASGRKIFTNQESASVLNMPAVEKPATPPFASHANAVLNRQLFLKTKKLMELYMPSRQFNVGSFILETDSFINFFPTTNNTGTYAYVSVIGNEVKDYLIFKIELQEMLPSLDTITVVGMTMDHARALTDWIHNSFADELAGKKLQFYVYENDTYYTYPHEASFRID